MTPDTDRLQALLDAADDLLVDLWYRDPDRSSCLQGALRAAVVMFRRAPEGPVREYLLDELEEYLDDLLLIDSAVDQPDPANQNRVFRDPLPDAAEPREVPEWIELNVPYCDDPDDPDRRTIHPWVPGLS